MMSRHDLIEAFTLDGISGGDAVFNPDKLDWFNAQYLAQLEPDDLLERVKPQLEAAGLWSEEYESERREWLQRVLKLVLPRARRLPDLVEHARPFLAGGVEYDPEAVRKHLTQADLDRHIDAFTAALEEQADPFDQVTVERVLRGVADARGIKAAALIHAARVAATGKGVSPGIFEVLALLGKPVTLARLRALVTFLRADAAAARA